MVQPCVNDANATRLIHAILIDPRHPNTIRDSDIVARRLSRKALQIVGLESFTDVGMCGNPVGDVFLADGFRIL